MLDPEQVDLADLAVALEDHTEHHTWWFDPTAGHVTPRFAGEPDELPADGLVAIDPLPPSVGYADMEDFVARLRDPGARRVLQQALTGRGAFRRFKDALLDHPELRRGWFAFHDARGERRAAAWLAQRGFVDAAVVAACARPEPDVEALPGMFDAESIARRTARDLRRLYRERLRGVLLTGGWARGDAHPESPLELLVVLDAVLDPWVEHRRMDRVLWRHSIRNDTVVLARPVADAEPDGAAEVVPIA